MKEIRKKIGQLFMTGVSGLKLTENERKIHKKIKTGGVILFGRNYQNIDQLIDMVNDIYKTIPAPLIGVDQEGGNVIRFKKPFTQFPGNDYLGRSYEKTGSLELAKEYANLLSLELKSCGINLCFAPVVDVLTNPENKVIGKRAFSEKPMIVSEVASAVISQMTECGIISCAKHFPGHGDTFLDSHEDLPRIKHDLEFLMKREFMPFKRVISNNVPMIMTAHIIYEKLDKNFPATLSRKIVSNILRKKLSFENVVITDDLDMKAVSKDHDIHEAAYLSLKAGADIILICHSFEKVLKAYEYVVKKLEKESIFKNKVKASLKRIENLKKKYVKKRRGINSKIAKSFFNQAQSHNLVEKISHYS